jgi:hypothetical protein
MNALQKTLALIAFLVLCSQTVRHGYMLWIEPRGSVLDKYDSPVKGQAAEATSLDELLRRYEPIRKQADVAREEAAKSGEKPNYEERAEKEPYKSEKTLRDAINDWETKAKEIREIRFYSLTAFIIAVLGVVVYLKQNRWFGMAMITTGFSEMCYWTSPSFFGSSHEFDRLLVNKLVLSIVSLILLLTAVQLMGIFSTEDSRPVARGR